MDARQTRIVSLLVLAVGLCWLAAPFALRGRVPEPVLSGGTLRFSGDEALRATTDFVTRFPRRVVGSLESRQSSGHLQERLAELGYDVGYLHFEALTGGPHEAGRNVFAAKAGQSPEIIALLAHYDTARTTVQGAMDNGSGVGVLLELARVFSKESMHRSLLVALTDAEEWGMLGAADLVRSHPDRNRIVAAVSVDGVSVGDLAAIEIAAEGQLQGYAPPWLRRLAAAAGGADGLPVRQPFGLFEVLERALLVSWHDQGPLLSAGMPAINLGSRSKDELLESRVYHTERDTVENLKPESFAPVGRAAERMIRSLDALPSIPAGSQSWLALSPDRFVPGGAALALQVLSFVPLGVALGFQVRNHAKAVSRERVLREVTCLVAGVLPFLAFFYTIRLVRLLRLFPRYVLYPATPRDPALEHPAQGALWAILIVTLFTAVVCFFGARYLVRQFQKADFHVSKLLLLGALSLCVVAGLAYNPYWAASFLLLPAWIWALVGPGRGAGDRAANALWILAAGIVYFALSWHFATWLGLGWKLLWYEILALNTGLFHPAAFVVGSFVAVVGIRLLAIQTLSEPGATRGARLGER